MTARLKRGEYMERRKVNISFTKSGSGSRSTRLMLPVKWIDNLGISPEDREVFIYQIGDNILIRKKPLKWNKKEAVKIVCDEIDKIIQDEKIIFYDRALLIGDDVFNMYFGDDKESQYLYFDGFISGVKDYMFKNYKDIVLDREKFILYFFSKEHDYKDPEEFKKIFNITN